MKLTSESRSRVTPALIAFCYWLLCGVLPATVLLRSYSDGSLYSRLYAHHFLFPLFFGFFAIYFVTKPFLAALRLLPRSKRTQLITLWLAFTTFALIAEVSSDNIAPWEVSAPVLEANPELVAHISKRPSSTVTNEDFQRQLLTLISDRHNWSASRYIYFVSFFVQTAGFLLTFLVAGIIAILHASQQGASRDSLRPVTIEITLAIFISTFFLLMRIAFSSQKLKYYPSESLAAGDIAIIALFLGGYIYLCSILWGWFDERLKAVFGIIFGSGVAGILFKQDMLLRLFGADAQISSYFVLVALSLFLFLPWLFLPPRDQPPDEPTI